MQYGIAFTPLVPSLVLWLALAAIVVISALLLLGRARGAAVRVAALALILLALANPSFTREDREPLSSGAAGGGGGPGFFSVGRGHPCFSPRGPGAVVVGGRGGDRQEPQPELWYAHA